MKIDKRLKLLSQVDKLNDFNLDKELKYSLTINYKNIVFDFKYQKLNFEDIKNHINQFEDIINSYNLTITNRDRYDEEKYSKYYLDYDIILTSEEVLVNLSSRFLQLPYCNIKDNSIDNALQLINFYKDKSKEVWNKVTELISNKIH